MNPTANVSLQPSGASGYRRPIEVPMASTAGKTILSELGGSFPGGNGQKGGERLWDTKLCCHSQVVGPEWVVRGVISRPVSVKCTKASDKTKSVKRNDNPEPKHFKSIIKETTSPEVQRTRKPLIYGIRSACCFRANAPFPKYCQQDYERAPHRVEGHPERSRHLGPNPSKHHLVEKSPSHMHFTHRPV